jgi:hypothetical protein
MIKFTIGGKTVDPRNMADALMAAVLEGIRAQITEKIGAIRDPDTGEFPTVIVRGESIENLTLHVEGSPKLVALVKERLGMEEKEDGKAAAPEASPRAFLSYTSDDLDFARRIAEALQASGIETWWDRWCIYPGDSLRRKIDEGIAGCTHFLVLLTPQSIGKPWVNQEMDAGLVRKLNDQCRFLPVRYGLPASALPPLLSGMHSPEIAADEDIAQLINDIYGVSRKPPRGAPPAAVQNAAAAKTGYSAAASAVARLFVERSQHGLFADPQMDVEDVAKETGLSLEDAKDALYELSGFLKISLDHVLVQGTLFAEFDRYWKPWNPAEDALRLAADIVNDPELPADCKQIAERYGWEPRRLNPAIAYLLERRLIVDYQAIGSAPWAIVRIVGNEHIRRFVKSRS